MTVGVYLKELRVAKGLSQKELSGLPDKQVSNAEISRLEAGIRIKPSPAILKILAPHLGVPVGALLARAGYMDEPSDGGGEQGGVISAFPASSENAGELAEENRALKEKNESLREESRRIKEETIFLLEEASSLRVEADSYRKRMTTAEETARKAKIDLETVEEELNGLKEKGVMFVPESDEEKDKEYERLKNELMTVLEQKNDLQDDKETLASRLLAAENQLDEIKTKGEGGLSAAAGMIEEISEISYRLKIKEIDFDELAEEKQKLTRDKQMLIEEKEGLTREKLALTEEMLALTHETDGLKRSLEEAKAFNIKLTEDNAALKQQVEDLENADTGNAPGVLSGEADDDRTATLQEIEELKSRIVQMEAGENQVNKEKAALEKELQALKETMSLSTPMLENISNIQSAGMDLGQIFLQTARNADAGDLDMLGRLMQAMGSDAVKASDKKILVDILKRFIR